MLHAKSPPLIAGLLVILVIAGTAVTLAIGRDDDSSGPMPTATSAAPVQTPTVLVVSPTATLAPSATPVLPTATVETAEIWGIEFQRTGGFAGLSQRLKVNSGGLAVYEDLRAGRMETGTVSPADLSDLRSLINTSSFFSQPTPQEAPCADCFNLSITVTLGGSTHTVQAVDIGLDPGLKPLVDKLVTLLQDGLTP